MQLVKRMQYILVLHQSLPARASLHVWTWLTAILPWFGRYEFLTRMHWRMGGSTRLFIDILTDPLITATYLGRCLIFAYCVLGLGLVRWIIPGSPKFITRKWRRRRSRLCVTYAVPSRRYNGPSTARHLHTVAQPTRQTCPTSRINILFEHIHRIRTLWQPSLLLRRSYQKNMEWANELFEFSLETNIFAIVVLFLIYFVFLGIPVLILCCIFSYCEKKRWLKLSMRNEDLASVKPKEKPKQSWDACYCTVPSTVELL